jgi:hypothetical protein
MCGPSKFSRGNRVFPQPAKSGLKDWFVGQVFNLTLNIDFDGAKRAGFPYLLLNQPYRETMINRLRTSASLKTLFPLASLFLGELSIMAIVMAIHIKGERPFAEFLSSNSGLVFLLAIAVSLIAGALIICQYLVSKRSQSSHFRLIVTMNLITVILVMITVEVSLRLITHSVKEGEAVNGIVLLPKKWDNIALYFREHLDPTGNPITFSGGWDRTTSYSYVVYDDLMGWTIGPNRRSADSLYASSSEGIRAPHKDVTFAESTGKTRIAVVGDSNAFGEEVAYEHTWGFFLEKALGPGFQVLNFGVPAYGVDQAYLRFEKDVRVWKPKIVILGFIGDDLIRTMNVYPFLAFQWDWPFSKPRFVLRDGHLSRVNVPPLMPKAIFSANSIHELPFLNLQRGYKRTDWENNLYHFSYLSRLLVSWFPRWSVKSPEVSDQATVSVNAEILKAFIRSATQMGAIPIVVYFPQEELRAVRPNSSLPMWKLVLREADIAYTDPSPCLLELNSADRMLIYHYSPQANEKIAKCLHDVVVQKLAG